MSHPSADRPSGRLRSGGRTESSAFSTGGSADHRGGLGDGPKAREHEPAGPDSQAADDPAVDDPGFPPGDPVVLGPEADTEGVARKILLDQLTGQARSRAELATKLAKRRVPAEVAERLLTRFEEVGLVDDAAFARAWVESRQPGKGLGRRVLAQELRRKGVDEDLAREALEEIDPADEEEAARLLVRRKLRTLRRVDRPTAMRRLTGMLARKGHSAGVAWRVVREELEASGFGEPDDEEVGLADGGETGAHDDLQAP